MLCRANSMEKGPEDVETSSGMGAPSYHSSNGREPNYEETTELHQSIPVRILDSFKRNPNAQITPNGVLKNDGTIFQTNKGVAPESPLARRLKGRHLQMIAIGGSIGTSSRLEAPRALEHCLIFSGTGLFVASGKALATGGPASVLLTFTIIGVMIYCVIQALGELAVLFPVAGSFSAYSSRFLDPAWGFAMGWVRNNPST
jgi:yeast amino acid transporter